MRKKKGTPFDPLEGSHPDKIVGEFGSGKSVFLESLVTEEAEHLGISYEDASRGLYPDVDTGAGDSADPSASTDPTLRGKRNGRD